MTHAHSHTRTHKWDRGRGGRKEGRKRRGGGRACVRVASLHYAVKVQMTRPLPSTKSSLARSLGATRAGERAQQQQATNEEERWLATELAGQPKKPEGNQKGEEQQTEGRGSGPKLGSWPMGARQAIFGPMRVQVRRAPIRAPSVLVRMRRCSSSTFACACSLTVAFALSTGNGKPASIQTPTRFG